MISFLIQDKPKDELPDAAKLVLLVLFAVIMIWSMMNWRKKERPPQSRHEHDPVAERRRAIGLPDLPPLPEAASPEQVELHAALQSAFNQTTGTIEELDRQIAEASSWGAAIREVQECLEKGQDTSKLTPMAQRYLLHLHDRIQNPPSPDEVAADRLAEIDSADREIATLRGFLGRPTATGEVRASLENCLRIAEERKRRAEER